MSFFVLPASFNSLDVTKAQLLNKENNKIPVKEFYGSIKSLTGSGRRATSLPVADLKDLEIYIDSLSKNHINFSYTLNGTSLHNTFPFSTPKDSINKLVDCGVKEYTVASKEVMEVLRRYSADAIIHVSTIYGIKSTRDLMKLHSRYGISSVYIHEDCNVDYALIGELVDCSLSIGVEVGVVLNSTCLIGCKERNKHYAFVSSNRSLKGDINHYSIRCRIKKLNTPSVWLKMSWVPPEEIANLQKIGVNRLKFAGREMIRDGADFFRTVASYQQGRYSGNLITLFQGNIDTPLSDAVAIENGDKPPNSNITRYTVTINKERREIYMMELKKMLSRSKLL